MAESVDALDSKSSDESRASSTLARGTKYISNFAMELHNAKTSQEDKEDT